MTAVTDTAALSAEAPSALRTVNMVLRGRRVIVASALLVATLVVGALLLGKRTYTATASFTPASSNRSSALLSGLAAQLGVAGNAPEQSPQFYTELVETRSILAEVAQTPYRVRSGESSKSGTVMDLLNIRDANPARRLERTVLKLRALVTPRTSVRTGVVIITVKARWPELSEGIARQLLDLVNQFNLVSRQSQAAAERDFVEGRLDSVRRELRSAEDRLLRFLQSNREFRSSPLLMFEQDRLAREVGIHQQVFASLAQAREQARIDAVRNTPVITIIERPVRPAKPDSRKVVAWGIVSLGFGAVIGALFVFGPALFASGKRDPDALATYRQLRAETVRDLRSLGLRFLNVPRT